MLMLRRIAIALLCCALFAHCAAVHAQVIYSNGGFSTGAVAENGAVAPTGRTWSETQHNTGNNAESNTSAGFNGQAGLFRVADNFIVPANQRWTISGVINHAYRAGYTGANSPFTTGTLRIWRGRPGDAASVVIFGDTGTNRLASSADELIYRIFNSVVPPPGIAPGTTRRVWRSTLNVAPTLAVGPGTYWVDYDLSGTNFHPAVTQVGNRGDQPPRGWNARQFSVGAGAWQDLQDLGNPGSAPDVPQDIAFELTGTIESDLVLGACCLPLNNCTTALTASDCAALGGIYQGDNSNCARCMGACCAADGGCAVRGPFDCQQAGGTYSGPDTNCGTPAYGAQITMTELEDISTTGTPLVLDSGNPDEGSGSAAIGFSFLFYGAPFNTVRIGTNGYLVFTSNPADGNISLTAPIPSPTPPNNFIAPLWDDLDATGGPPIVTRLVGAAPNRRFIIQWTHIAHFLVNGSDSTFQAVLFESSNLIEFRYGALNPDPAYQAIHGVENSAGTMGTAIAGFPHSNSSVMLAPGGLQCPQPSGACCLLSGMCASMPALECQLSGGIWRGAGVNCQQAACTPAGACCLIGGSCEVLTAAACASESGSYQGDQTTCGPNPCVGRCCFSSGSCETLLGDDCVTAGGVYAGGGTTCIGNPCGGACCVSGDSCTFTSSNGCAALSGRYGGDGSSCGPNACVGGCCLANQSCQVLSLPACQSAGGQYRGDGSVCGGYNILVSPQALLDISTTGARLMGGGAAPDSGTLDDGSSLVNLPFTFMFFNQPQNAVRVSTNGYLIFGGTLEQSWDFSNDPIPTPAPPNNIICPAWDDYRLTQSTGTIHTQTFGVVGQRRFVAQWTNCELFLNAAPPNNTFQVLLYEGSGLIEFRYGAMNAVPPRSATIGVENAAGDAGASASDNSIGAGQTARFVIPADACSSPTPGACCVGSDCALRTFVECQMSGGRFMGAGESCAPSICNPIVNTCLPGDTNLDRRLDGDDVNGMTRAIIVGPGDPQFCFVDAQPDGVITGEDLAIVTNCLLRWPNGDVNGGDYWPISVACDGGRRTVILPCHATNTDTDVAVRNNGAPGDCSVFIQRQSCAGADIGTPVQVLPGAIGCFRLVAANERVAAWCAADGNACRLSVKYLTGGTCPP